MPTCSAESEKAIGLPEIEIGLQIFASFTFRLCPEGVKLRSFVFSGTRVTWKVEQYLSHSLFFVYLHVYPLSRDGLGLLVIRHPDADPFPSVFWNSVLV